MGSLIETIKNRYSNTVSPKTTPVLDKVVQRYTEQPMADIKKIGPVQYQLKTNSPSNDDLLSKGQFNPPAKAPTKSLSIKNELGKLLTGQDLMIGPVERSPLQKLFGKLPKKVQEIGGDIKDSFLGQGAVRSDKVDTGLMGFIAPIVQTDNNKLKMATDTYNAIKDLNISEERKQELVLDQIRPSLIQQTKSGTRLPPSPELTDEENKALRPIKIENAINKFFTGLDVISLGTIKPATIPAREILTKLATEVSESGLRNILKSELKLADDAVESVLPRLVGKEQSIEEVADVFSDVSKGVTPPPTTPKSTDLLDDGAKERAFTQTLRESPNTSPALSARLQSLYNPITNAATKKEADDLILNDFNKAINIAEDSSKPASALSNTVAQVLINKYDRENNIEVAVRLAEITAARSTTAGQAIQALSIWNKLSPEGILMYTERQIEKANQGLKPGSKIVLPPEKARQITDKVKKIQQMPDGEDKIVETGTLIKDIHDLLPVSFAKKLATYQTIAQLVNPKTFIRNLGGNFGFAALENIKDAAAIALDTPLSLITGQRTATLPSLPTQKTAFAAGMKQGIRDAKLGIDTLGTSSQWELPKTPVFKSGVGKKAEQLLNLSLKATDRAFFAAAYDGSLYKQMKIAGISEPTEAMKEIAWHEGLYRTFQDDTALSLAFSRIKQALNTASSYVTGTEEFGLGDVLLKYPKTPANLLERGISYSPAGFAKVLYSGSKTLMGKEVFDQRKFVDDFTRALIGTGGLVGSGALMHRLGIITGKPADDKDIATIQKETGLGQYRVNVSALKRFALSWDVEEAKLREDDTLISYDWMQPAAISVSIGANLDEGATTGSLVTTIIDSLASGLDTLAEQPLVGNLTNILKYGNASDALIKTAQQIPQTMVPTLLNQIRQLTDNTKRNVYDPSTVNYAFNLAKNKIPGVSRTMEPLISPFGREQKIYQEPESTLGRAIINPFNVFFNPAFVSKYKPTPEAKLVLDLFEQTGETTQAPRVVKTKQNVRVKNEDGSYEEKSIQLSPEQVTQLQRFVGTASRESFYKIATNPASEKAPPEEMVKFLGNQITDIGTAGRILVLGHRPKKKPNSRVLKIINYWLANQ